MGYFISKPIPWGKNMPIEDAKQHIFGFVLLNDWSARDHQLFEMRPLVGSRSFIPPFVDFERRADNPRVPSTPKASAQASPTGLSRLKL
jgi:2-keto-4-pentenoate hydratase/2-oxohepta-3-ene-1,7-dioic acid hydratase in catechol pathway